MKNLPENYRPISLLLIYNRIFEKLMDSRLTKFVKDCHILYDQQYGFRSKHSSQHAILDIVNTNLQNMDNGKFQCGVFIDLRKAFDTVNHEILARGFLFLICFQEYIFTCIKLFKALNLNTPWITPSQAKLVKL